MVLPYINMNLPQVYTCSPSWTLLPPRTIPMGRPSAPAPSIQYRASDLDWRLISYMILYMFQCHSPKSSYPLPLPESKRLFYTSVTLLLSHIQGYCYHISKFHIYAFNSSVLFHEHKIRAFQLLSSYIALAFQFLYPQRNRFYVLSQVTILLIIYDIFIPQQYFYPMFLKTQFSATFYVSS